MEFPLTWGSPPPVQQDWKSVGTYGTVGLEFFLSIALGWFIGKKGDEWLGTQPWLTVLWTGFGLAAGSRAIWRALQQANREAEREAEREREARKNYSNERQQPDDD